MITAEILIAASPRPWVLEKGNAWTGSDYAFDPQEASPDAEAQARANETLAVLAVNAYERDQRIIERHTEAIEQMTVDHKPDCVCIGCTALAMAKESQ